MKSKKTGRKVVWVFGAGASRGAGAYSLIQKGGKILIPTQSDFWETVLRFASSEDRKLIEAFLFRYFKGYSKTPPKIKPTQRKKHFNGVNVEEVFTFLSERVSTKTIASQLQKYFQNDIWPALIRSIANTFRRFSANQATKSVFKGFEQQHLRSRDVIISFNYDTILEGSLSKDTWAYYELADTTRKIPILKPHGSINWVETTNEQIKISTTAVPPLIVAPTHLKFIGLKEINSNSSGYLDTNQTITEIWSEMEKQMKKAKVIVFVGYSFPDADLYFSSVLRTVLTSARSLRIVLVNPDSKALAEKISERFSIDSKSIGNHFDFKNFTYLSRKNVINT